MGNRQWAMGFADPGYCPLPIAHCRRFAFFLPPTRSTPKFHPMTDIRALLQNVQQMQGKLAAMQTELANRTVTGTSGAGMVTVTADGRGQVRDVKIDPSVATGDVEMLEDLVLAAVVEVQKKAAEIAQEEARKLQSALPFPLPFSL